VLVGLVVFLGFAAGNFYSNQVEPRQLSASILPLEVRSDVEESLDLINSERTSRGLKALKLYWELEESAQDWSEYQAAGKCGSSGTGNICHDPNLASDIVATSWSTLSENVGVGPSVSSIHDAFMRSSGHKNNMLRSRYDYIGVGVAKRPDGWLVVTHKFMDASPSLVIHEKLKLVDTGEGRWKQAPNYSGYAYKNAYYYGNPGDYPMAGDWDCDGVKTAGLYRRSDGFVYLTNKPENPGNAEIKFFFGNPNDIPIAGDFNGNGCDTVSLYRPNNNRFYIINKLGKNNGGLGAAEMDFEFRRTGDIPIVGDFNGNGRDSVGIYQVSSGRYYYELWLNRGGLRSGTFANPTSGDKAMTGDWDGTGKDQVGVYRPSKARFYLKKPDGGERSLSIKNVKGKASKLIPVTF